MAKLAVYAGTFDPPTNGHLYVIEKSVEVFDKLIIAVGINPKKICMFTPEERLNMLRDLTENFPNVSLDIFPYKLLVHYAKSVGAKFIVRGMRSSPDYEFEKEMNDVNCEISNSVTTWFLMPPPNLTTVRSSTVKELAGLEGWEDIARKYVSQHVIEKLKEKHYGRA